MSESSTSSYNLFFRRSLLFAISIGGAMLLWPQAGMAQLDGPFAKFSGSWRGSGQVIGTDGNSEKIRCRANYSASARGEALSQSLVCASDSYRVDIHSYVVADGHSVQGYWQETTRNVSGHLTGQVGDGQFADARPASETSTVAVSPARQLIEDRTVRHRSARSDKAFRIAII
jgi:hypothetical protein